MVLCGSLDTLPVQCLRPSEKVEVLTFLIDHLLSSKSLCREIDSRMERVSKFRREKWKVNMKLKRFHSKLVSVADSNKRKIVIYSGRGRPPKQALGAANTKNSQERTSGDDGEGGDGDGSPDHEQVSDPECSDEATDEDVPTEKAELQRRIRELKKKQTIVRAQIHRHMKKIRKFPLGQDRYARQYWLLPHLGCILVEGTETGLGQHLHLAKEEEEEEEGYCHGNMEEGGTSSGVLKPPPHPHPGHDDMEQSQDTLTSRQNDSRLIPDSPRDCEDSQTPRTHIPTSTQSPPPPPNQIQLPPPPPITANHGAHQSAPALTLNGCSPSLHTTTSHGWFSLFPRSSCDHILPAPPPTRASPPVAVVATPQQQQQQYFLSGSYGQPAAYTYITSGGALLAQPIGMGYGLVGSAMLPQTQYIAVNPSPQVQYIVTGNQGNQQDVQYVAFGGEGQVVVVPSGPAKSAGNASVLAEVPVEAAPSSTRSRPSSPAGNIASTAVEEATPAPLNGEVLASVSSGGGPQQLQHQVATGDSSVQSANNTDPEGGRSLERPTAITPAATPLPVPAVSSDVGVMGSAPYYSIVLQVGNEGQWNETDGDPFSVEIVLLYAEQVREATPPAPRRAAEERGRRGKSLLQLLDTVDKELTQGWWFISDPLLLESLLRGLCLRGYREKGFHKVLHKSKDQVLTSLHPSPIKHWQQLAHGSDGGDGDDDGDGDDGGDGGDDGDDGDDGAEHTQEDMKDSGDGSLVKDREQSVEGSESQPMDLGKEDGGSDSDGVAVVGDGGQVTTPSRSNGDDRPSAEEGVATSEGASSAGSMGGGRSQAGNEAGPSHVTGARCEEAGPSHVTDACCEEAGPSHVMDARCEEAELPQSGVSSRPGVILGQCRVLDPPAPEMNGKVMEQVRERIEGMEQRLAIAKLQAKDHLRQAAGDLDGSSKAGDQLSELKVRLLRLEQQVYRKFLKPPLGDDDPEEGSSHAKKVAMDTPPSETLVAWRAAVQSASSASQIAVCVNVLDQSISWEKSTSKVFCQVCRRGDSESLLLLCDGCDKGTHTYCCVPPLDAIPDGDWYCHHCAQVKPKKKTKASDASSTKQQTLKDEMALCHVLLDALEENEDCWPFLEPVEKKAFPEYFKVIKKPMDLQTVRNKLEEKK
eukprot:Em0007g1360a